MREEIEIYIKLNKTKVLFLVSLLFLIISGFLLLISPNDEMIKLILKLSFLLLIISIIWEFWNFFSSDRRQNHEFTVIHASNALSGFYRIYFPIIILSIVSVVLVAFALLPESDGGWAALDPDVSPSGMLALGIIPSLVIGVGLILLSDLEMRKKKLLFAPRKKNMSFKRSLLYLPPLLGIYFGIIFFLQFILESIYGPRILFPANQNQFTLEGSLIDAARFWIFLTDKEKLLVLLAFIILYIGLEFLLRGLIANEARSLGLGPGGIVLVPAVIQGMAFSSGNLVLTDPAYYFFIVFNGLLLGTMIGIVLWRTGRFSTTIAIAILSRLLDHAHHLDFQRTVLNSLPEAFGIYDPLNAEVTLADDIGSYLILMQILLIIFSPFFLFAAYNETWKILTSLWVAIKKQWFGYIVLGFAFFLIDIIFSYFAGINPFFPFFGFILALLVIGFALRYLFKVLPFNLDLIASISDYQFKEYPVDVVLDIAYIERKNMWYDNSKLVGILGGIAFLYLLFISAAYRQYTILTQYESILFTTFLIVLPTLLISISSFLLVKAYSRGYFFAESWRKTLLSVLTVVYFLNLYLWTVAGSLTNFSWRNVPLFVCYLILLTPKPIKTPLKDFSLGLQGTGRYATFRYIDYNPTEFILEYETLEKFESEAVQIGTKIMGSKLNIVDERMEINILGNSEISRGSKIASIIAIGMIGTKSSESILLKYLEDDDDDVKLVSYWALGRVGSSTVLGRMAQVLEGNPKRSIVSIAEKAILSIDPNYPLAGMRANVVLEH